MIEKLNELIKLKKSEKLSEIDIKKILLIEKIIKEENWMFKFNADIVIEMLIFLGMSETEAEEKYLLLISSDNYLKYIPKERI